MSPCSHALRVEHQAVEVFLDQPYLPGVVRGLEVLQVVVAVDVDELKLAVLGRVALLGEPLVEHQVVLLRLAGELAPDDQRASAVGRDACDGAKPPRPGGVLLEVALEAQPLLAIALECGCKRLRGGDVLDCEADQIVESLQQIDVYLAALVAARALDLELVGRWVLKRLDVEQRLDCRASPRRAYSAAGTAP